MEQYPFLYANLLLDCQRIEFIQKCAIKFSPHTIVSYDGGACLRDRPQAGTPVVSVQDSSLVIKLILLCRDDSTKQTLKRTGVEEELWTDKYRPRHFTDLLGDEVGITPLFGRATLNIIKEGTSRRNDMG